MTFNALVIGDTYPPSPMPTHIQERVAGTELADKKVPMTVFAEKLATLPNTIRLAGEGPVADLAEALHAGHGRPTLALGSGGSAVTAAYLAHCRTSLGLGFTAVQTPMEFVLSMHDWSGWDIWLFSAGADNADISAAYTMAKSSSAQAIYLVTINPDGATATRARLDLRVQTFVAPTSERKDGFLATHSMVAMITALLAASGHVAGNSAPDQLVTRFDSVVQAVLEEQRAADAVRDFCVGDTIIIMHDPRCQTLATLIETSLWETGIAPVQRTDFRNFAHGRHVWAARHPSKMLMLALTAAESRAVWQPIAAALPGDIRAGSLDLGHAGRFRTAVSVIEGLVLINALGERSQTDPGKPGRGPFAGAIYDDAALSDLAVAFTSNVVHKSRAIQFNDEERCREEAVHCAGRDWKVSLSAAAIGGVVMDYDGTIVTTEERLSPPSSAIIGEIIRLLDAGIAVGFATGRGGSAGEMLRSVLPERVHDYVLMGYYNGSHIRPLSVDIQLEPPPFHSAIETIGAWIEGSGLIRLGATFKHGPVQVTIGRDDVLAPELFLQSLRRHPDVANGSVVVTQSHHSYDLYPSGTSKRAVIEAVQAGMADNVLKVLALGDSGSALGNDHDLLSQQPSISVDSVCGDLDGCWTIFGHDAKGPSALLRILEALTVESGVARLHLSGLRDEYDEKG